MTDKIRNFCIIAHIDHGKSTLADRMLQMTNTVSERELKGQMLDDMDLEQERGITIRAHAIQMEYETADGEKYVFNLIDTPGHVDFSYEVSRSIAACEGAILVVDASQGIEAQTLTNLYLAMEHDLEIIPVINKIDLPAAQPENVASQVIDLIGCDDDDIVFTSAKTGEGVLDLLNKIVKDIPSPDDSGEKEPLQAMIFDSIYDQFRGVVANIKVVNGKIKARDRIKLFNTGQIFEVEELGILKMDRIKKKELNVGEVGYLIVGTKNAKDIKVGDTVTYEKNGSLEPLPGYQEVKPMVFSGVFPVNTEDYQELKDSLEKLQLNDSSLIYEPEKSTALGFGFRVGYLGLLHMEIINERMHREYGLSVINTFPSVTYRVYNISGEMREVNNPKDFNPENVKRVEEPFINAQIITLTEHIGPIMKLALERRGIYKATDYLDETRVVLKYDFPLSEVIFDFFDKLKSISRGYASFDYELSDYRQSDMMKLDIMLNGEKVDALAAIIHKDKAYHYGQKICVKLKEIIPRQMYDIAIQAGIGSRIIARTTVKALRKDVTAKCYGGDISRKRKLLEKQKKGKKKMKQIGSVELPQEAFLALLKIDD